MVTRADGEAEKAPSPERDVRGRFAAGNRGGPGNPRARQVAEIRSAIREAIGPPILIAVAKSMAKRALGGDVTAARLLFDHVLGRPRELPEEPEFEMPPITSVQDVPDVFNRLLQAVATGEIDVDTLVRMAKVLDQFIKAAEAADRAEAERVAAEQAKVDLTEFERYL